MNLNTFTKSKPPFYSLNENKKYPALVQPGYNPQGMVNFAELHKSGLGYRWDVYEGKPCCYELRKGHAVAFELRSQPWYHHHLQTDENKSEFPSAAARWREFLTGPESPWRKALKDWEFFVDPKGNPTGIIVKDCHVSRALLHNFFLALRCIWEHPQDVVRFSRLIDAGLPAQAAIYYAWSTYEEGTRVTNMRGNSHTFMYSPYQTIPILHRFYDLPDSVISPALFDSDHCPSGFIESNQVWHERSVLDATMWNFKTSLPSVLSEFPSASVYANPHDPRNFKQISVTDFYNEAKIAYLKRLAIEKEKLGL